MAKDYRASFEEAVHAHGCMRCHVRYEDKCKEPLEDGMCWLCWTDGERPIPWWPENWLPTRCCPTRSRKLDPDDERSLELLNQHKLVGMHTWWRCPECARTFPYDPAKDYRPAITQDAWRERNAG